MCAADQQVGIEFQGRGAIPGISVFCGGENEIVDPGAPLPTPLKDQELIDLFTAAVMAAPSLTANRCVAAELLNSSFFEISPEAQFLLRIAAVEALCPQGEQPQTLTDLVYELLAALGSKPSNADRAQIEEVLKRLAKRQSVRSAYMSKIRSLLGDDKAKRFEALYQQRSEFLHDGKGRGSFGEPAKAALELGLELLFATGLS